MKDHHKLPEITLRNTPLHGNVIKPEPYLSVGRWVITALLEDGEQVHNALPEDLYMQSNGNGMVSEYKWCGLLPLGSHRSLAGQRANS